MKFKTKYLLKSKNYFQTKIKMFECIREKESQSVSVANYISFPFYNIYYKIYLDIFFY